MPKISDFNPRAQSQIREQLARENLCSVCMRWGTHRSNECPTLNHDKTALKESQSDCGALPEPAFLPPDTAYKGPEKDIHELIIGECRKRRWYFVHSRTDRRTTTAIGVPDFIIATFDKVWWIEVKRKGSKVTREQAAVGIMLKALNQNYAVVYSFEEFISVINT